MTKVARIFLLSYKNYGLLCSCFQGCVTALKTAVKVAFIFHADVVLARRTMLLCRENNCDNSKKMQ